MIKKNLNSKVIGNKIFVFKTIDSTNEEAKRQIINGIVENGSIIIAEHQSNGKGRNRRNWIDNGEKEILMSIILKEERPINNSIITLLVGLIICKYLRNVTSKNFMLKWPNDIIINNKKVCGILIESIIYNPKNNFIIIGIGLNVNQQEFLSNTLKKATSIYLETNIIYDRNKIIRDLANLLDKELNNFYFEREINFIDEYQSLCATIGKQISINRNNNIINGTAICINKDGELIATTNDQNIININFGDVSVQGIY